MAERETLRRDRMGAESSRLAARKSDASNGSIVKQQLEARRQDLLKIHAELTQLVDAATDAIKPVDVDEPIGRLSRVEAMQEQRMSAENRQSAQRRRRQVEAALARIEAGVYGDCEACGEPIEPRRLEVQPEAPLCIDCQSGREQRD